MVRFPDWIYRQSAVLPFRRDDGDLRVLLITSRGGRRWVLPKGIVEPGMTAPVSAAKEAREEAGIEGAVSDRALGSYSQDKWGGTCRIEVFPMRVTSEHDHWPEAAIRRREWLPVKAAAKRVEDKKLRKILKKLPERLAKESEEATTATTSAIETPRLLYLLRHTKSSWDDPSLADFERPLAERGRASAEIMSEYMQMGDIEPDLVLCSAATRTRQTLAGIRPAIAEGTKVRFEKQLYHGGAEDLLARLRRVAGTVNTVMLIGHNPAMEMLAERLVGGGDPEARERMAAKFPTGALATLVVEAKSWKDLGPGSCRLHSFVTPRELA